MSDPCAHAQFVTVLSSLLTVAIQDTHPEISAEHSSIVRPACSHKKLDKVLLQSQVAPPWSHLQQTFMDHLHNFDTDGLLYQALQGGLRRCEGFKDSHQPEKASVPSFLCGIATMHLRSVHVHPPTEDKYF